MRDAPKVELRCQNRNHQIPLKGVDSLRQQGCGHKSRHQLRNANAYLPNELALKMDGAILRYRYSTIVASIMLQWVRGRRYSVEAEVKTKVKLYLVPILVVPWEQQLVMGYSILRHSGNAVNTVINCDAEREWGSYSSSWPWILCGNINKLGDICAFLQKSSLFFLTA